MPRVQIDEVRSYYNIKVKVQLKLQNETGKKEEETTVVERMKRTQLS